MRCDVSRQAGSVGQSVSQLVVLKSVGWLEGWPAQVFQVGCLLFLFSFLDQEIFFRLGSLRIQNSRCQVPRRRRTTPVKFASGSFALLFAFFLSSVLRIDEGEGMGYKFVHFSAFFLSLARPPPIPSDPPLPLPRIMRVISNLACVGCPLPLMNALVVPCLVDDASPKSDMPISLSPSLLTDLDTARYYTFNTKQGYLRGSRTLA
ncbi:hypothetical protein GGR52DRAFT_304727 [Hypoxylon sp. FL1284]|nr:hypothetical protein GGR52DRAFT_304727 [Hypoxylon sp. FL1284]